MSPARLLLYCRAGFEKECAQEITAIAGAMGVEGFVKARPESAFALFEAHDEAMGVELGKRLRLRDFVFARQVVRAGALVSLPETDRVAPIVEAVRALGRRFSTLWIEMPDTNDGKSLATLTRPLTPHIEKGLAKAGVVLGGEAAERLHLFFLGGRACHAGVTDPRDSSPWPMGIPRLRMPGRAPSRSTLKLAEAFQQFFGDEELARRVRPGMTAVDLGASPGGWTWQLVRRGLMVTAVDNGPMDEALFETGQVKQRREDAFRFRPGEPVDWMVCDVVESPSRVARLVAQWVAEGWCRHAIFNLKLPMKRRWEEIERSRELVAEAFPGSGYHLRMRHLYHDREEVTAFLERTGRRSR